MHASSVMDVINRYMSAVLGPRDTSLGLRCNRRNASATGSQNLLDSEVKKVRTVSGLFSGTSR